MSVCSCLHAATGQFARVYLPLLEFARVYMPLLEFARVYMRLLDSLLVFSSRYLSLLVFTGSMGDGRISGANSCNFNFHRGTFQLKLLQRVANFFS